MKIIKSLILFVTIALTSSCTENTRAKAFGGTATVELPEGKKFVSATWKDQQLWYIYRDGRFGEMPETFILKEKSSFGLVEGEVKFVEK